MHYYIVLTVALIFVIRLFFLKISKKNEKAILENGGKEYGAANSKRLTILHIAFYLFSVIEAIVRKTSLDAISLVGLGLIVFSMIMLAVVVNLLKDIWTVKLMLLNNHKYNPHWLFKVVKHPNYFLNIAPELIGLTVFCHAWYTLAVLAPFYVFTMYIRIKEEEKLLKEIIIPNGVMEA